MDKNIGKRLDGRYEITELIGVGGMADVYKATDVVDNKTVAVKILKKEFSENEEFLRRFRNESKAIAVLSHPNIVKIYDVGFTDKVQYIVMEYIDGITLKDYIETEKVLGWKDAVHFIIQILRALQHAHDRGIIHRDIKPQNIMMFTDGTIKVMDFGIAKFNRDEGKTATDQAIGSVHYISPEQARGDETDAKSDIYSVGVMLYEMLTGQKPFDTDNPVTVAVMQMQSIAESPRSINPEIPLGLEEIILKAMEKDASKRYQTASEMIKDIEKFKSDPDFVFGYSSEKVNSAVAVGANDTSTKFFNAVPAGNVVSDNDEFDENDEFNDEEFYDTDGEDGEFDDEEDEEQAKSLFVPILSGVTIVVIVVVVIFVVALINNKFKENSSGSQVTLNDVVGMTIDEAEDKYPDIKFEQSGDAEWSDEYEADVIIWQKITSGSKIEKGTVVEVKISKGIKTAQVPDVTNFTKEAAESALKQDFTNIQIKNIPDDTVKSGYVIRTDPVAGTEVAVNQTIMLYISMGNSNEIQVPSLVNKLFDNAKTECDSLSLKLSISEEVDSSKPKGTILSQSIDAGTKVTADTEIKVTVSNGNAPTNTITMAFSIPSDASGRFEVVVYDENGVELGSSGTVNVAYSSSISVPVSGSGLKEGCFAELKNISNGAVARIGKYSLDFDSSTKTTTSEDVRGAFSSVDGISVATDALESTKAPVVQTTKAPETTKKPETVAPETEVPETVAPETEVQETEATVEDSGV